MSRLLLISVVIIFGLGVDAMPAKGQTEFKVFGPEVKSRIEQSIVPSVIGEVPELESFFKNILGGFGGGIENFPGSLQEEGGTSSIETTEVSKEEVGKFLRFAIEFMRGLLDLFSKFVEAIF